jgi:hypothetical protein
VRLALGAGSISRRCGSRSPQVPGPPGSLPSRESAGLREKIAGHAACSHNRLMAKRAVFAFVFVGGLSAAWLAGACGNYVPPDVASDQGPANGLQGKSIPGPPDEEGGSGVAPSSSSGSSSGTGTSSGGPTGPFLCQTQTPAGTIVDGGACSVSFTNDIYPKMQSGGTWGCAVAGTCHGGATAPNLQGSTAASFYTGLATDGVPVNGVTVPVVNPCSTSPTESVFVCVTVPTGATGACSSQMPISTPISAADNATIATWVACGAPFN